VVEGKLVDVDELSLKPDYAAANVMRIARYQSPTLHRIVDEINKESDNLISEQVLKSLALYVDPENGKRPAQGTLELGVETAMKTFAAAGVDTSRISMRDGSGLSRYNLISPEMTTSLLHYMWVHADTSVSGSFIRSLPISGVDGTLESFPDSSASSGNVRAKTGTMTGVRNLSGYVTTAGGTDLAFSLLCNNFTVPTKEVVRVQQEFIELLGRYRK
jgi:D-alanyl-D-alanine carboxypeptidase/D-alanyl-D-alanine-endopeptidase (penicillin-binding protein 4)